MAEKMHCVRFIKHTLPYVAGEQAWFSEIQAASYVRQGFAVHVPGAVYVPYKNRAQRLAEGE